MFDGPPPSGGAKVPKSNQNIASNYFNTMNNSSSNYFGESGTFDSDMQNNDASQFFNNLAYSQQ
jgi:hypothetical protein